MVPTVDEVMSVISNETGIDKKKIAPSTRLNDLGLTSYSLMRLLMRVEDHFDCEIDAADLMGVFIHPISDLRDTIERTIVASS